MNSSIKASPGALRVAAITGGTNVPSRRFRVDALKLDLERHNVFLSEFCPKISRYPPPSKLLRPFWLAGAITERLNLCWRAQGFDSVILQRELISTLPTIESIVPGHKIFDVDDAIFLKRNGIAARHCAHVCNLVVCGNDWLAEHFSAWNDNIEVIPTGVDTRALKPLNTTTLDRPPVIGWIGTSGNLKFLYNFAKDIVNALDAVAGSSLHIVSDSIDAIPKILSPYVRFTPWRPGIEGATIPYWTVGIMPLDDDDWSRGKCAFKLLQYLAAGIPAVASPVGANQKILSSGNFGFAARTGQDWTDALVHLLTNRDYSHQAGLAGRKFVEDKYSVRSVAERWDVVLRKQVR